MSKIHVVIEMFMRGRKLNLSLVFISQKTGFYLLFEVPKEIRLNARH